MNQVKEALELWVELTGIDPNATKIRFKEWEIHNLNKELRESLLLDATNLSTLMLLDTFSKEYMKTRSFSVQEMLENYDSVRAYLDKSKSLQRILSDEKLEEEKESFKKWLVNALEHYNVENQETYKMASSYEELGFLRRDALRSIKTLEVHQFTHGSGSEENPRYVKQVHEFWNINSLIHTMANDATLSGISLNLIRDPLDTSSYFAFGIKNGGTLTILTDKPSYVHPLQKYITRRPGREMSQRISKNHFPYDLLDIEEDSRGDVYMKQGNSTDVVVYQPVLRPLKKLKELAPDEVIWIVMMFSLIKEKFWDKDFQTKELSYTGEMAVDKNTLMKNMDSLSLRNYNALELKPVKNEEVLSENLQNNWSSSPTGKNDWMEKRYGNKANETILNLIGHNQQVPLLGESQSIHEISRTEFEVRTNPFMGNDIKKKELMKLDTTIFGTKEEIRKTQIWTARYNKALVIQQEADKEFKAREQEIRNFFYERLKKNQENILKAIAHGEMIAPQKDDVWGALGDSPETKNKNILRLLKSEDREFLYRKVGKKLFTEREDRHYGCYVNGSKATIVAQIRPNTPEALALICDCEVSELPDVLQEWLDVEIYSGNHLLQNVDPMEWVAKNPWREMKFDIEVHLSKSAYNDLQKRYGVPANKFWLKGE